MKNRRGLDLDELLTDSILLSTMMEDLKEFSKGTREALIDERDRYIAEKIMQSKPEKMLVVLVAHLKGIERALNHKPFRLKNSNQFRQYQRKESWVKCFHLQSH